MNNRGNISSYGTEFKIYRRRHCGNLRLNHNPILQFDSVANDPRNPADSVVSASKGEDMARKSGRSRKRKSKAEDGHECVSAHSNAKASIDVPPAANQKNSNIVSEPDATPPKGIEVLLGAIKVQDRPNAPSHVKYFDNLHSKHVQKARVHWHLTNWPLLAPILVLVLP